MFNKLRQIVSNYEDLSSRMSNPDIISNIQEYTKLAKEHRYLNHIIPKAKAYINIYKQIEESPPAEIPNRPPRAAHRTARARKLGVEGHDRGLPDRAPA